MNATVNLFKNYLVDYCSLYNAWIIHLQVKQNIKIFNFMYSFNNVSAYNFKHGRFAHSTWSYLYLEISL